MGLDMYAYVANKAGERDEFYERSEWNPATREFENPSVTKPRELAYWRKHPNLHGWMEQLWIRKMNQDGKTVVEDVDTLSDTFNGIELELTWDDLDELEKTVKERQLPTTTGFFFGNPSDQHYYNDDLEFIKNAKAEIFVGLKVFYNSSW